MDKLMNRLKLDRIRNIIIYLSSIILVFSLFFPVQGADNGVIQRAAFIFLLYGLILWFLATMAHRLKGRASRNDKLAVDFMRAAITLILFILAFYLAFL